MGLPLPALFGSTKPLPSAAGGGVRPGSYTQLTLATILRVVGARRGVGGRQNAGPTPSRTGKALLTGQCCFAAVGCDGRRAPDLEETTRACAGAGTLAHVPTRHRDFACGLDLEARGSLLYGERKKGLETP